MKLGDFTTLAAHYDNRGAYSLRALAVIMSASGLAQPRFADVGAGTGKLTNNLLQLGLTGVAVEPNDAMRATGERGCLDPSRVVWHAGTGEETGLPSSSADWLLMASSFHWTDPNRSLPEFHRVLRAGGTLTVLWNPRDLERSDLHARIEKRIEALVPSLRRVSSGGGRYTANIEDTLLSTGHFKDCFFVECRHEESMTPERYLGAWRSVNDIQVQAGPEGFERVMAAVAEEISGLSEVVVPYKTRAWTVRAHTPTHS